MAEKRINGTTYRVLPLPAPKAIAIKARIGKTIGAGFEEVASAVIAAVSAEGDVKAGAEAAIFRGIGAVFANCDPDDVVNLCREIVSCAEVKTESGNWDQVDLDVDFTENPQDLYEVMAFVVKEGPGAFMPAAARNRLAKSVGKS